MQNKTYKIPNTQSSAFASFFFAILHEKLSSNDLQTINANDVTFGDFDILDHMSDLEFSDIISPGAGIE